MQLRGAALAFLCGSWALLAGFAARGEIRLAYAFDDLVAPGKPQPVEPGEQYPPAGQDRTISPEREAPAGTPKRRGADWTLSVDTSITADSNVTNATGANTIVVDYGTGPLPVPLDPNLRRRSGLGFGASAAASVKVPVAQGISVSVGAEGYAIDYPGRRADDASATVSAGLDFERGKSVASLQAVGFDRWYGGVSAMAGGGLRANWRQEVGDGQHVALYLDARVFSSDYGEAFGGHQGSAYLAYNAVLDPTLTVAGGVYVRREWLNDDAFTSTELGAYGSLTHYLGKSLTAGLSAGAGRLRYDAPVLFLSPDPRNDWRYYASLYLTTRKPVLWGISPSLTYTYSRTASTISFYRAERHRLRLGMMRSF